MKQRTIAKAVSIRGKSLHMGEDTTLTLQPAPVDHGVRFKRVDLYGMPELQPSAELATDLVRSTTIVSGHTKLHTIEHILSALNGLGIDNALIEINNSEPPILDGSAKHFVNLIQEAEIVEQEKDRQYFVLDKPISVTVGRGSIIALPYDGFKVTCTSADDRGFHSQHLSLDIDPETYAAHIAPARTFTFYEDIEPLLKIGKIQGGSLDCAIVIKGDKILSKEPLRFKDEFVRHKILDIIGDVSLLKIKLKAHIIAICPSHALNAELTKELLRYYQASMHPGKSAKPSLAQALPETEMDIRRILDILPHRYPFVMIDRVVKIQEEGELTAIKNVTINEPYFVGHFPGLPVMPGVLQLEAMAQAAGILMYRKLGLEKKIAYFMSCDKVKFRKPVTPGDQLEIIVKLKDSSRKLIGVAEGMCKVNGKVVSSAELMFGVTDMLNP